MKQQPVHLQAFSLVEVAMALGIIAFCLAVLIGLVSVGMTSNQGSLEETTAASLASAVVSDLRTASTNSDSPLYRILVPGAGSPSTTTTPSATLYMADDGSTNSSPSAAGIRFRVDVGFSSPATGQRTATPVRVLVSWPPQGNSAGAWPAHSQGTFETTTSLDCN